MAGCGDLRAPFLQIYIPVPRCSKCPLIRVMRVVQSGAPGIHVGPPDHAPFEPHTEYAVPNTVLTRIETPSLSPPADRINHWIREYTSD